MQQTELHSFTYTPDTLSQLAAIIFALWTTDVVNDLRQRITTLSSVKYMNICKRKTSEKCVYF